MILGELEIYKLALELSEVAWDIYSKMDKETKIILGSQFITAMDSIGANIAEGYGRFHYLDKNKFMYNARGSLMESIFWVEQLYRRLNILKEKFDFLIGLLNKELCKLNAFIATTKSMAQKN